MKHTYIYLIGLSKNYFGVPDQTINLKCPHFTGRTYECKIVQGNKHIVLQNNTIPQDGKGQLQIAPKYKGNKGVSIWYLTKLEAQGLTWSTINFTGDFS